MSCYPDTVAEFREENPEATVYVLRGGPGRFEELAPGAPWEPVEVRFRASRHTIAAWLDEVRATCWHLCRATGWCMNISTSHNDDGIGVRAWLHPQDEDEGFIGPLMNLGPAFLLMEQEHLLHLATLMTCEVHVLAHTDLGVP